MCFRPLAFLGSLVEKKRAKKGEFIQNRDQNFINDPFAINSRPSPSTTSKGVKRVRHGSGQPVVKQKYTKPKPDSHSYAQAASSPQTAASQHQNQLEQKFIVCDTNTWMQSLRVITAILHDSQMVNYNIYVPYKVGEELDYKKKDPDPDTSANARKAIIARNDFMKAYPSRVIQQTNLESRTALFNHYSFTTKADHEIIAACLKLRADGKEVEMCTNDKNLECEAMANDIPIHPPITPNMRRQIIESKCFCNYFSKLQKSEKYFHISTIFQNAETSVENSKKETRQKMTNFLMIWSPILISM